MLLLENKKTNRKNLDRFLSFDKTSKTFLEITALQNEISVTSDAVTITLVAVNDDYLSSTFAKAMASTFGFNKKRTLIIDANLYDPQLGEALKLKKDDDSVKKNSNKKPKAISIDKYIDVICFDKETYPPETYKRDFFAKLISNSRKSYDHILVIAPNLIEHADSALIAKNTDCVLLLSQRNVTERAQIHRALQTVKELQLPLSKVVVVK